jgi:hypothetical protein
LCLTNSASATGGRHMCELHVGCAIRAHAPKREPVLYARLIYISESDDLAVISRFPGTDKHGYRKHYYPRPNPIALSNLRRKIDAGEWSAAEFETPSHWLLSTHQLRQNTRDGLLRSTRRNLIKWVRRRAKAYGRIRPFVHGRSLEQVVLDPAFSGWPTTRAKELGLAGCSQVQRDLNAYVFALGLRNGLLPWYVHSGAPGQQKISKKKTGRPNEFGDDKRPNLQGLNCDSATRTAFALGWKKYKKPGVSVKQAFVYTLNEWFCTSVQWDGSTAKVKLRPEASRYTVDQFAYWGQRQEGALSAIQIERGETEAKRVYMRRQGSIKERFLSINSDAFLDSTSTDQTLVSCGSRLKVISAPWRTDVLGTSIDYIFGHHVGFENPSAATSLMAILHAAQDKVEYCAHFDIKIQPRDWLPMTFRRFITDNGEGKGKLAMSTLEEMECGASYGSAYDAINKAPSESTHRKTQRLLDHLMPGSTMGRRARRGEPERETLARLNFYEYMPRLIKRILHHNNVERIPIPTLEMRRDGIDPTRRGVLEWMIANGYVSSSPTDLTALRIKCLPPIKACLQSDGLHLYDPRYSGKRIIPKLVYTSDWLQRSSLLARASCSRWHLDAHINPSEPSHVWVNLDGLKRLDMKTADPEMLRITLWDWLTISDDDRLCGFLSRVDEIRNGIDQAAAIKIATTQANRQRNAEIKARGTKPTKASIKKDKRLNTAAERAAHTGIPRPPAGASVGSAPPERRPTTANVPLITTPLIADFSDVISALRKL